MNLAAALSSLTEGLTLAQPGERKTHPLRAWRETQQVRDPRSGKERTMGIADAARAIKVPYQTWMNWELYPEEHGARVPAPDNMRKIVKLTRGQVRPDHFYDLPTLRSTLGAATGGANEHAT